MIYRKYDIVPALRGLSCGKAGFLRHKRGIESPRWGRIGLRSAFLLRWPDSGGDVGRMKGSIRMVPERLKRRSPHFVKVRGEGAGKRPRHGLR